MELEEEVFEEETKPEKKIRRRTNNLYKMIRQQMEFYFSDSNLLRDRFLQQIIQDSIDGYIDVEIFMKFNKIRALTKNPRDITNAMSKSKIIELNENKTKLRRILPVKQRANVDDCTIYVERLPEEVNHDWLKTVFSRFGTVLYVGLPRFRQSGRLKGFSFIEFDTPEAAQKACQYFGSEDEENELSQQPTEETASCVIGEEALPPQQEKKSSKRKRKKERDEEEEKGKRQKVEEDEEVPNNSDKEQSKKDESLEETSEKHKKKKHRRRDKHKKKAKAESEVEDFGLRVMSKREWKNWKNRYLSLQKKAMTQIKYALFLNNHPTESMENKVIKEPENKPKSKNIIEFQPGVIIKIDTETPVLEVSKFKEKVRKLGEVAYVDVNKEETIAYVRCLNNETAKKILENDLQEEIGKLTLVTGKEEEMYWEKIKSDKEKKYSSNNKQKKRGRDKIVAKVDKLIQNKHIRFED